MVSVKEAPSSVPMTIADTKEENSLIWILAAMRWSATVRSTPSSISLSIIAYSQPITRAEIEGLRGVSADNMIRLLMERNLIKEVGKKDVPGKPTQYGTTKEFLKFFRLNSIADLPKLDQEEEERFELAR